MSTLMYSRVKLEAINKQLEPCELTFLVYIRPWRPQKSWPYCAYFLNSALRSLLGISFCTTYQSFLAFFYLQSVKRGSWVQKGWKSGTRNCWIAANRPLVYKTYNEQEGEKNTAGRSKGWSEYGWPQAQRFNRAPRGAAVLLLGLTWEMNSNGYGL